MTETLLNFDPSLYKTMPESAVNETEELVPFSDVVLSGHNSALPPELEIPGVSFLYSREVHNPVVEVPIKTTYGKEFPTPTGDQVVPTGYEPYFLGQTKEANYYGNTYSGQGKDAIDITGEISKRGADEVDRMVRLHGQDFAQRAFYLLHHGQICSSGPQRQEDLGILVYLDSRLNLSTREWGLMAEHSPEATEYRNGTHDIAAKASVVMESNGNKKVSYPIKDRNTQPQQVLWRNLETRKKQYEDSFGQYIEREIIRLANEEQNVLNQNELTKLNMKKWFNLDIRKLQVGHEFMRLLGKQIGEMHVRAALSQIADKVPSNFRF